jgi:hypothetical protein
MDTYHVILLLLSLAILALAIYIFIRKQQQKEHFVNPLYNDKGGIDYDSQDFATIGGY